MRNVLTHNQPHTDHSIFTSAYKVILYKPSKRNISICTDQDNTEWDISYSVKSTCECSLVDKLQYVIMTPFLNYLKLSLAFLQIQKLCDQSYLQYPDTSSQHTHRNWYISNKLISDKILACPIYRSSSVFHDSIHIRPILTISTKAKDRLHNCLMVWGVYWSVRFQSSQGRFC